MKKNKKERILSPEELGEIKDWLKKAWKSAGPTPVMTGFADLILSGKPSERSFGRYAHSSTSGSKIAQASRLISVMETRLVHCDSELEQDVPNEVHVAIFEEFKGRIATNDHSFFECVAIMLRHRSEKKTPIAEMDWRSIKKHADAPSKPLARMTLPRAMEIAVFQVLRKRAPLIFWGDDPKMACNTAVRRSELRAALQGALRHEGITSGRITDSQMSQLLHGTPEGRFLVPFMQERPIMKRKQKLQRTRNREE